MIAGVGIDLVDVAAFASQLTDPASVFAERTFTPAERADADARPGARPARHLAARFAAKEAFVKAWSASRRGQPPALATLDLRDIEVVCDRHGRPALALHGAVAAALHGNGEAFACHVSLSHDGTHATAVVVLDHAPGATP